MDKWNLVEAGSGRTESSLDDIWRGRQTQQLADAHAGGERRQESGPVYDSPGRPYAAVRNTANLFAADWQPLSGRASRP